MYVFISIAQNFNDIQLLLIIFFIFETDNKILMINNLIIYLSVNVTHALIGFHALREYKAQSSRMLMPYTEFVLKIKARL